MDDIRAPLGAGDVRALLDAGNVRAFLDAGEIRALLEAGDVRALLQARGRDQEVLWEAADAVRRRSVGDVVHLRALLEFSNRCVQDCRYCGLRRSRRDIARFALEPEAVVRAALDAGRVGYGTVVLQSGEDPDYDRETIADIVRRIKAGAPALRVTLSVGERSYDDYRAWRRAGADRYLLKHETADPQLYASLRPGHRLSQRLKRARWLAALGYAVGLGNMVGLPGQTLDALVADLRLLAAYRPEMIGIGPFLPHPRTPLAGQPAGDPLLTLNFIALTRLLLPDAMIPATTALATALPGGRELALRAGANVVMVNIGSPRSRSRYEIYPARDDGSSSWEVYRAAGRSRSPRGERRATAQSDRLGAAALSRQRAQVVAWLQAQGRVADALPAGQAADDAAGQRVQRTAGRTPYRP